MAMMRSRSGCASVADICGLRGSEEIVWLRSLLVEIEVLLRPLFRLR